MNIINIINYPNVTERRPKGLNCCTENTEAMAIIHE